MSPSQWMFWIVKPGTSCKVAVRVTSLVVSGFVGVTATDSIRGRSRRKSSSSTLPQVQLEVQGSSGSVDQPRFARAQGTGLEFAGTGTVAAKDMIPV